MIGAGVAQVRLDASKIVASHSVAGAGAEGAIARISRLISCRCRQERHIQDGNTAGECRRADGNAIVRKGDRFSVGCGRSVVIWRERGRKVTC